MRQYQEMYEIMVNENKDLFQRFFEIHEKYVLDPRGNQKTFNDIGREFQDTARIYERKLCGKTESGQYSKFSANLSEKFWDCIRKDFPKIDCVGIITS